MTIQRMDRVLIVVEDLEAAKASSPNSVTDLVELDAVDPTPLDFQLDTG